MGKGPFAILNQQYLSSTKYTALYNYKAVGSSVFITTYLFTIKIIKLIITFLFKFNLIHTFEKFYAVQLIAIGIIIGIYLDNS